MGCSTQGTPFDSDMYPFACSITSHLWIPCLWFLFLHWPILRSVDCLEVHIDLKASPIYHITTCCWLNKFALNSWILSRLHSSSPPSRWISWCFVSVNNVFKMAFLFFSLIIATWTVVSFLAHLCYLFAVFFEFSPFLSLILLGYQFEPSATSLLSQLQP